MNALGSVPQELRKLPQWVNWRPELRNGKTTKVPLDPRTGALASSIDPTTWASFEEAVARSERIGFVVTAKDPFAGVDLDRCLDDRLTFAPWARGIVEALRSYSEITPSGLGVRIWVKAALPPGGRKRGRLEVYDRLRFFVITGRHLNGTPATIEPRQAEIEALHARVFPSRPAASPRAATAAATDDETLLARALSARNGYKFARLWRGEWEGEYPSRSEADLALASMLAFWTANNPEHVDALFRQSGLFRPKWDERHFGDGTTYGERTVATAVEGHPR